MNNKTGKELLSLAQANLYAAVAKADGVVSRDESIKASWYAVKGQKLFNVLKVNNEVKKILKKDIDEMFKSTEYETWDAYRHLDRAVELFSTAKDKGEWSVQLAAARNEEGLMQLAEIDGYNIKESRLLKEINKRLKQFK